MTDENEPRTTIRHEEVHIQQPRSSGGGWWVAAILAVALVAGGFFLFRLSGDRAGDANEHDSSDHSARSIAF